jgi:voltage-gated potassium channel
MHRLYNGRDRRAVRFRYGLLTFDVVTVVIFIIDSMLPPLPSMRLADSAIAVVLIADFAARCLIAPNRFRYLIRPLALADIVVILTLLLPFLINNWAFLRVLRALRLLRSYRVVHDLETRSRFFKRHRSVFDATINLFVFVFVITAVVYVTQRNVNPHIATYVDALYFTVATLTTTGFGDITLAGEGGKLLAVLMMLVGIGLFLRLVQAVFRPSKVDAPCPDCGLRFHDEDAIHCKHCGRVLNIEAEGA